MQKFFLIISVLFFQQIINAQLKVQNLLTENLVNPLGIDVAHPRFSWQLQSPKKELKQTAFEIIVTDNNKTMWSSGKILSDQSVQIKYAGPALTSGTKYQWKVRVWDNKGSFSAFSTPAFFSMGLLDQGDWKAKWISPGYEEVVHAQPSPVFRKSFSFSKKIATAFAYITAHGVYEGSINGKRIGDAFFTPGWTSYDKRLQYQAFDVTSLLTKGNNEINVILGNGWYRGKVGFTARSNAYGKELALLFQLAITYVDGTTATVISDESWQSATGPIRSSDFFDGEVYDARKETGPWTGVKLADISFANLVGTANQLIRKKESVQPVKISTMPSGETLVDFGQNLVGFVRLKVAGQPGDSIRLEHAEVLDQKGNLYLDNLRTARARNIYVLKGNGEETFEPHFTWQGFRYLRIRGLRRELKSSQLEAVVLYSDMTATGSFECSNEKLNRLQQNICWSQKGNFLDIPSDCPQRDERMGWLGDAQLFSRTACFNYNVNAFFDKFMQDVALDQLPDGNVPVAIPNLFGGAFVGAAGWADAIAIIPWNMYELYGDTSILARLYPYMKRWTDFQEKNSTGYLRNLTFQYGDWLSFTTNEPSEPNRSAITDRQLLTNAYYANTVRLMLSSAKLLNKTADIPYYQTLLKNIKAAFQREFVTPGGSLVSNTQTAYAVTLAFDLIPEELRKTAAAKLVANLKMYDNNLTTGLMGTPVLCHVLAQFGYADIAYEVLLKESYPSWLYAINKGATTIWERWDGIKPDGSFQNPAMNSFNHYAYGAIGDWMYQYIGGIQCAAPGYKKIRIAPKPGGNLSFANCSLESNYGRIRSEWKIENGKFILDVEIPVNTTAEIILPDETIHSVGSGVYHFEITNVS